MGYTTIICIVILFLCAIISGIKVQEGFSNSNSSQISFVTKQEFEEKIRMSAKYFSNLTQLDLIARGATTQQEYIKAYYNAYRDFTDSEKKRLETLVTLANGILDSKTYRRFRAIPWKFVKVDNALENGYPHTLYDTIIVTSELLQGADNTVIKTLLHEKVHIFQRFHPIIVRELLRDLAWVPLTPTTLETVKPTLYNMRSNPDLDNLIYVFGDDKLVVFQVYTSDQPKSLQESRTQVYKLDNPTEKLPPVSNNTFDIPENIICQLEHPYEIMACIIAHILTDSNIEKISSNRTVGYIMQWMNQHFTKVIHTE